MKDTNINVRLDPDLKERLDRASDKLGFTASSMIRMLLGRFIDHCEKHGGKIVMPPEFRDYEIREKKI